MFELFLVVCVKFWKDAWVWSWYWTHLRHRRKSRGRNSDIQVSRLLLGKDRLLKWKVVQPKEKKRKRRREGGKLPLQPHTHTHNHHSVIHNHWHKKAAHISSICPIFVGSHTHTARRTHTNHLLQSQISAWWCFSIETALTSWKHISCRGLCNQYNGANLNRQRISLLWLR